MTTANSTLLFEQRKGTAKDKIKAAVETIFAGEIALIHDRLGPDYQISDDDKRALRVQIEESLEAAAN